MRTVVLGDHHPELTEWIASPPPMGRDRLDEVWDGEYHVAAAPNFFHSIAAGQLALVLGRLAPSRGLVLGTEFNLGSGEHNFRVPDLGLHRVVLDEAWVSTAAKGDGQSRT